MKEKMHSERANESPYRERCAQLVEKNGNRGPEKEEHRKSDRKKDRKVENDRKRLKLKLRAAF